MCFITYIYLFEEVGTMSMLLWLNVNVLLELTQVLSFATN